MGQVNFGQLNTFGQHFSLLLKARNLTSVPIKGAGESGTTEWNNMNSTSGMEGELWVNQTKLEDEYEMEPDDGGEHDSTTATIAALLIVFSLLSNMTLILATVSK